ncbi:MAG: hypothetical protein IE933_11945 [Sphingomonadales bacterium]|nr:hypothetical protein [Sphingomonadales bacterium]MBD3774735.1 hypothetical protein [Paracoccaceae bacterium]
MTELTTDTAIEHVGRRSIAATLPRGEWTHAAHFALALWVLRHAPELAAPDAFRAIILRLNKAHGTANTDSSGYHHTITLASLHVARLALVGHGHAANEGLADVLSALMGGPYGKSDWILAHWSKDRLFSVAARRDWVPPDLAPLPE